MFASNQPYLALAANVAWYHQTFLPALTDETLEFDAEATRLVDLYTVASKIDAHHLPTPEQIDDFNTACDLWRLRVNASS